MISYPLTTRLGLEPKLYSKIYASRSPDKKCAWLRGLNAIRTYFMSAKEYFAIPVLTPER